ncbi:MAG: cytidine deaminase [Alloprevotella sp.]|nr:cytidine deaminase [Alloprevotella sp.]
MIKSYLCIKLQPYTLTKSLFVMQKEYSVNFVELSFDELAEADAQLVAQARQATDSSYSPFSHFRVGAAILMDNGEILTGSNQENASFTTGTCAERCTIFYANARYPGVGVKAIAIAAKDTTGEFTDEPVSPCGACRQVLTEVEHRYHPMRTLLCGKDRVYIFDRVGDLLPFQFNSDSL